jgi:hypothetical protein
VVKKKKKNKFLLDKEANKMRRLFVVLMIGAVLFVMSACSSTTRPTTTEIYNKPEEVHIFSVPANSISREVKDSRPEILKGFPFISYNPVGNFKGKFPPEFYSRIKYRWSADYLKVADLWKLRTDKYFYDVIYITPLWIGDLILKNNDLLKTIAYSYNIPDEQLGVLDDWIKEGGVLWIESAIYISAYDYSLNKFNDKKISDLVSRLKRMTLFGHKINVHMYKANRIDEFNTERFVKEVIPDKAGSEKNVGDQVDKMLLEQTDFIGIYLTIEGDPIIKSGSSVYASSIDYGKGKVITLAPFDFRNAHYDGELFRLDLLSWALQERS